MKNKYGLDIRYAEYASKDGGYCVYAVYGEDPNCDMGGSHVCPFLGNVEGTFNDVLVYAADNMKGFYAWGGGGHIRPASSLKETVKPIILNNAKKLKIERKAKLDNLVVIDIDNLIDNIDNMSKQEILECLNNIKGKVSK